MLICLSGNVLGIPFGMLASPYKNEGGHFERISQIVAGFLSGYLLSKSDVVFKDMHFDNEIVVGRLFLFISFFVLGAVQTFIFRRYSDISRAKDTFVPIDQTKQENP